MSTIRDVARAAGVSIATVSRVFNGTNRVSEAARSRVQAAARDLDYWPNVTARNLIKSRTHTLGVLLPDLYGEFFSDVIRGIDHAAADAKHQVLLASSHADANDFISAARAMRGRVDGLVAMVSDRHSAAAVAQITRYFNVVLLNPRTLVDGCSAVSITNFEGAYSMVEHLLRLGHRRIAMIKGPSDTGDAEERLRGYREALRRAGCRPQRSLEYAGDFTEASGYRAALAMLAKPSRPTALFAANDYMAVGAMSALRDAAIDVPGQMAVAGFDDIAMAEYLAPPLTTVHVDAYELGARATELWMHRVQNPGACSHEVLHTKLVVRGSCGATHARAADTRERRRRPRRQARAAAAQPHRSIEADSRTRDKLAANVSRHQRATAPRTSLGGRPQS